jgi:hypothetical protein
MHDHVSSLWLWVLLTVHLPFIWSSRGFQVVSLASRHTLVVAGDVRTMEAMMNRFHYDVVVVVMYRS